MGRSKNYDTSLFFFPPHSHECKERKRRGRPGQEVTRQGPVVRRIVKIAVNESASERERAFFAHIEERRRQKATLTRSRAQLHVSRLSWKIELTAALRHVSISALSLSRTYADKSPDARCSPAREEILQLVLGGWWSISRGLFLCRELACVKFF